MIDFLLSRKTDFYFWTGIATVIAVMGSFGIGYTESSFPVRTILLLLLSCFLAFWHFSTSGAKTERTANSKAVALEV